jgi:hypothetical protein
MPETRRWRTSRKGGAGGSLKGLVIALVRQVLRSRAIRRIRYASTCLPYEFPALQKKYPHLRRFMFDYIDTTAVSLPRSRGLDILIGNSASINCNHLDVIQALKGCETPAERIVVPLSYAGSAAYRDAVIQAGRDAFGEKFMPLTTYMGIHEYTKLLQRCGFAIMGFLRQQATKNIQLLMSQGTKVFFFKDTEIFRYFAGAGYAVFSIEDDLNSSNLSSELSEDDFRRNRALIEEQFNYEANVKNLTLSLQEALTRGR